MPQFTALIVTRRKDGVPATYTLTHVIEDRIAMFNYVINRYTNKYEDVETITILSEEN
jgi:hypothetical protein